MSEALKKGIQQVAGHLGRAVQEKMYQVALDSSPGGSNEVEGAAARTRAKTGYDPEKYVAATAEQEQALYDRDNTQAKDSFFRKERAAQGRNKANFEYGIATNDQGNRADAAVEVLRGYNHARQANQSFLAQLNSNSM